MKQGQQAWLLGSSGNHEFSSVRFLTKAGEHEPRWIIRDGNARIGGGVDLEHVAIDDAGAHVSWSKGYKSFIPLDFFQYTWRA